MQYRTKKLLNSRKSLTIFNSLLQIRLYSFNILSRSFSQKKKKNSRKNNDYKRFVVEAKNWGRRAMIIFPPRKKKKKIEKNKFTRAFLCGLSSTKQRVSRVCTRRLAQRKSRRKRASRAQKEKLKCHGSTAIWAAA